MARATAPVRAPGIRGARSGPRSPVCPALPRRRPCRGPPRTPPSAPAAARRSRGAASTIGATTGRESRALCSESPAMAPAVLCSTAAAPPAPAVGARGRVSSGSGGEGRDGTRSSLPRNEAVRFVPAATRRDWRSRALPAPAARRGAGQRLGRQCGPGRAPVRRCRVSTPGRLSPTHVPNNALASGTLEQGAQPRHPMS